MKRPLLYALAMAALGVTAANATDPSAGQRSPPTLSAPSFQTQIQSTAPTQTTAQAEDPGNWPILPCPPANALNVGVVSSPKDWSSTAAPGLVLVKVLASPNLLQCYYTLQGGPPQTVFVLRRLVPFNACVEDPGRHLVFRCRPGTV